jgi:hypothetical protein
MPAGHAIERRQKPKGLLAKAEIRREKFILGLRGVCRNFLVCLREPFHQKSALSSISF